MITELLFPITVWHWIVLGLICLSLEMIIGTLDLLLISFASFGTALFAGLVPGLSNNWQSQIVFFAIAATISVILGRTVFRRGKWAQADHPTLNKRMQSLLGQTGVIETDFTGGQGRVRIGDTTWLAESDQDATDFTVGAVVSVVDVRDTIVRVKRTNAA